MNISKIWAIVVGASTIASIASWLHTIDFSKSGGAFFYPVFAIFFAGLSGYLIFQNYELVDIEKDAKQVLRSWSKEYLRGSGNDRGVILSGFTFIEKHRSYFPETYILAQELVRNSKPQFFETQDYETVETGKADPNYLNEVNRLLQGSIAMRGLIAGIAGENIFAE
jgi:hypothetical protein